MTSVKHIIKNWKQFQHFKDRSPPWIKLYRDLLNNPDWFALSDKNSKILIMLWLLASEDKTGNGYLPDIKTISFRLRISQSSLKSVINELNQWIDSVDIAVISEGYQEDAPETETETKTETEEAPLPPPCPHQEIVKRYNAILGAILPQVKPNLWNGTRKADLTSRWKEAPERQNLDWWNILFTDISRSAFLTGDNDRKWKADLGWILNKSNIVKILEGKYVDRNGEGGWV